MVLPPVTTCDRSKNDAPILDARYNCSRYNQRADIEPDPTISAGHCQTQQKTLVGRNASFLTFCELSISSHL